MRGQFIECLAELAETDDRIVLLTGDLGYMVLDDFARQFPKRFFNAGVAEQNMVGVATGLAEAGFVPFVYSIAPFASLRPYEFIRNGPVLQNLQVRVVGVGGGFEYGHNGATHYGLEDIGVLRVQPGMKIIAPADYQQARNALKATWDVPGPVYYRLGKDDKYTLPGLNGEFELGRAQCVREGTDILLLSMGSAATEAHAAAELLQTDGISCGMMVVPSLNPAPEADLAGALSRFRVAVTVEAHYVSGGLGSLVSEVVAENGLRCRVVRLAVKTTPDGISGSQAFMHEKHGLSARQIRQTAIDALGRPDFSAKSET